MLIAPTLSAEDFKKVHNGKCKLHSILERLKPVAKDELVGELERAIEEINAGLESAYAQETKLFDERSKLYDTIAGRHGLRYSRWSMYEIDNMGFTPYPDAELLRYDGGHGKAVEVALGGDKTWTSLWIAADKAIRMSGDTHHIFIESLTLVDGVVVLSTGS